MTDRYYVTTDEHGVEHTVLGPVSWVLPETGAATTTTANGTPLVLRHAPELIEDLDAQIFVAEPAEAGVERAGLYEVESARLVARTAWDTEVAARFAIGCAEHALGPAGQATLPNGRTLAEVLADAHDALDAASPDAEARLGFLARIRAAHRLRQAGSTVQEIALELLTEDHESEVEAIEDPAWATAASVADAVLAAVEALRALALPRYVAAREESSDDRGEETPATRSALISSPWGAISVGSEHRSAYEPSWAAARDAAARARDAVRERDGEHAEQTERAFQGELLERLL